MTDNPEGESDDLGLLLGQLGRIGIEHRERLVCIDKRNAAATAASIFPQLAPHLAPLLGIDQLSFARGILSRGVNED